MTTLPHPTFLIFSFVAVKSYLGTKNLCTCAKCVYVGDQPFVPIRFRRMFITWNYSAFKVRFEQHLQYMAFNEFFKIINALINKNMQLRLSWKSFFIGIIFRRSKQKLIVYLPPIIIIIHSFSINIYLLSTKFKHQQQLYFRTA